MRSVYLTSQDRVLARADQMLINFGFQRTSDQEALTYRRELGAFLVRVQLPLMARPGGVKLRLAFRNKAGVYVNARPWSFPVAPDPWSVAVEAVWFVAVVAGLTPPAMVGTVAPTDRRGGAAQDDQGEALAG